MKIRTGQKCAIRESVLGTPQFVSHLHRIGIDTNQPCEYLAGLFTVKSIVVNPNVSNPPYAFGYDEDNPHLLNIQSLPRLTTECVEIPLAWVRLF